MRNCIAFAVLANENVSAPHPALTLPVASLPIVRSVVCFPCNESALKFGLDAIDNAGWLGTIRFKNLSLMHKRFAISAKLVLAERMKEKVDLLKIGGKYSQFN